MEDLESFNHSALYNAGYNKTAYFENPKNVIGSFRRCDICGKIPTEIFANVGFSCLNYCPTCRPNAYEPKSIIAKLLWWLDRKFGDELWPKAPTIKNGDIVTYSPLNKHHSGEPTAYGGITGVVGGLDDENSFWIDAENCTLVVPSKYRNRWGNIVKDKSILLEKDGITFRHYFKHK